MINRYDLSTDVPQPIRQILPANTDLFHTLKMGERLDNLANVYYLDPGLSWIIMYGNPQFDNEFEVPINAVLRIPYPLTRVTSTWLINKDI